MAIDSDADNWAAAWEGLVLGGRYQIETLLGSGGMGAVFRGQQLTLRKPVAIKLLRPEYARREIYRERFLREARAASRIGHRNVVDISDFGETDDGEVFFVMELLEGEDLAQRLRRVGALRWRAARVLLLQIIRGLKAAHGRDVIHRDIKPANVFLVRTPDDEPDEVKLLDFGVAKVTDPTSSDAAGLTSADKIMGTAMFMAPEQALGKEADARADVYALGCIAYQMLAGRPAYPGVNAIEILMRRLNEPPPSLTDELAHIPASIEGFVRQAMARDPVARFQSMREMEEALRALPVDIDEERVPTAPVPLASSASVMPTATGSRRVAASSGSRPSAVPTEAVDRASDEHAGGTAPLAQPSTANNRRLTEPVSRPELVPPRPGPAWGGPDEPDAAPSARRAWWIAIPVALLGLGGAGLWLGRDDPAGPPAAHDDARDAAVAGAAEDGAPAAATPAGPAAAPTEVAAAPETTGPEGAPPDAGSESGAAPAGGDTGGVPSIPPLAVDPADSGDDPPKTRPAPTRPKRRRNAKPPGPAPTKAPAERNLAGGKAKLTASLRTACHGDADSEVRVSFNVEPSGRTGVIAARGDVDGALKDCIRDHVAAFSFAAGSSTDAVSLRVRW
jgi:serine/threonine protein kinase